MAAGGNDGSLKFDTKIDPGGFMDGISTLTKAVENLTKVMESLSGNIVKQFGSAGSAAASASKEVDAIGEAAQKSEAKVKSLQEQMDEISVHTMQDSAVDTTTATPVSAPVSQEAMQYDPEAMAAVFGEAAAEIHNYAEAVNQFGAEAGMAMNTSAQGASIAKAEIGQLDDAVERSGQSYVGIKDSVINAFQNMPAVFARIPAAVGGALGKIPGIVRSAFSSATRTVLNFGHTLGTTISNGAKRAVTHLRGLIKPADKVGKSILKLSSMFKLMLIRMAMRAVIQGVKEGMQNLVQYSDSANRSMSNLVSGMTYLKNSFAAAFAPILSYVAPVLNTLINLLATAIGYINQFFAALGGGKTFIKAKKVNQDYAKSIGAAGGAAKQAGKDAKKALAPFDELNTIQEQGSGDGGGGGGAGAGAADMFETSAIDKGISDFASKLKALYAAEDWYGIGALIAEKLNAGLQKVYDVISWDNVGPKITYFVNAFTTTFNSLVDNLDWELLGRVVGAGVNTIVNTLNLLIEGIDWINLGKKFAEGMDGLVDEIDWKNLGNLIGNKLMIIPGILLGFVQNFDWSALGTGVGDAINGAIEKIDPAVLAQGASGLVKGLLDSVNRALITTDWQSIGNKIAEFFRNIDYSGVASSLFYGIGAVLSSLSEFLYGLIEDAWSAVVKWWEETAYEDGQFTMEGLLKGILEVIKNIGSWIRKNIFDPFMKGIRDAWGIHSPSTVMAEIGKFLMEGLKNGIANFIPNVVAKFAEIKAKISSKWDEVKADTSSKWSTIKGDLSGKWEEMKTSAGTAFGSIKDGITDAWKQVSQKTSEVWGSGGIAGIVSGAVNGIISSAETMANAVIRAINGLISGINKVSIDIPDTPFSSGVKLGFNIPSLSEVHLPRLATGTVVPPRAGEFAAILGDNNREAEIISPTSAIKQALRETFAEMHGMGENIHVTINLEGKPIYDGVVKRNRQETKRTGKNPMLVT